MESAPASAAKPKYKAIWKAVVFALFIVGAVVLVRYTPARSYLTADALGRFLETSGIWAPLVFILVYTAGVCLFIPGTLLTGLGAAIFGAYWGFVYVWIFLPLRLKVMVEPRSGYC